MSTSNISNIIHLCDDFFPWKLFLFFLLTMNTEVVTLCMTVVHSNVVLNRHASTTEEQESTMEELLNITSENLYGMFLFLSSYLIFYLLSPPCAMTPKTGK